MAEERFLTFSDILSPCKVVRGRENKRSNIPKKTFVREVIRVKEDSHKLQGKALS